MRVLSLSLVATLALAPQANASEPTELANAEQLEAAGAFASAGAAWEELTQRGEHDSQILAAYRAQKAYRAATDQEPGMLCRAHAVVVSALTRDDLDGDQRADFEGFRSEIEASAELSELCDVGDPPFLPVGETESPDAGVVAPDLAPVETRAEPTHPRHPRHPRRLQIAGAVLVSTGAGLLGLASYGVVEDYRAAKEILTFIPKNASVGLTEAEIGELRSAQRRAEVGSKIAIGAGVGAAVVVLTGAVLLGVGSRRARRRSDSELPLTTSLTPDVGRDYGGLALRGRF